MIPPKDLSPEHRAAQIWCLPEFSSRVMDPAFAKAIANAIREAEVNALEKGWIVIANAGSAIGDWGTCTKDWQEAAARFRDEYHEKLDAYVAQ